MAGLREVKKQQTHIAIVSEASRLFETNGYDKTTLADIAHACHIGVGTIYNYFPSKPDLLLSIFENGLNQDLVFIESILMDQQLAGIDKIKRISNRFMSSLLEKPRTLIREMMRLMLSNEVEAPKVLLHVVSADEMFLQVIRQCILIDVENGKRDVTFPVEQAIAVYFGVIRSEILNYISTNEIDKHTIILNVESHIDFIFS